MVAITPTIVLHPSYNVHRREGFSTPTSSEGL